MRYLIFFLMAAGCWGQIAVDYTTKSGSGGGSISNINTAVAAYGVIFTASSATTVTEFAVYSGSVGSANVDSLRVEVREMWGGTVGATITYTDASDLINFSNNPLVNGDVVRFAAATTLPTGLSATTDYYVCNRTSTTFQVDDDSGCASVVTDFSGSSGNQYVGKIVTVSTTFSPSPAMATSWLDFSSFSTHTLTAGRKYAAILLNTEAVPATDSVTIWHTNGEAPTLGVWSNNASPGSIIANTRGYNSTGFFPSGGYVTLADGVQSGSAAYTVNLDSTMRVHGTRQIGARFTTPANLKLNVAGIGTQIRAGTGNYPQNITISLYQIGSGTDTLLASCQASVVAASVTVSSWPCLLSSVVTLDASTSYRVSVSATSSAGDASNYLSLNRFLRRSGQTFDNEYSVQATYCAATCTTTSNWTDVADATSVFQLILSSTPYASTGGGSSGGSFVVAQ